MNKFLTIAALATVALVKGEADADAFYGAYGYGLGYSHGYGYAGYPYAAAYGAYAHPYAYGAYSQVSPSAAQTTLGLAQASIPAVAGGYASAGRYVANSAGVVHVAKRSADAEPEAEADAFYGTYGYGLPHTYGAYNGYAGYGYSGYPYTYGAYNGYAGYPYTTYAAATVATPAVKTVEAAPAVATIAAAPAVAAYAPYTYGAYAHHAYALPTATAQVSPSASLTTLGFADASIPAVAGGYAGAGRYVANSAGVVHVAKRSADAEPEADAFYGAYGYGLPYSYGAYNTGYGYAGYPYTYGAYPYTTYATVATPAVKTVEATPAVATVAGAPAVAAYAPYTYALPTATAQVSPSASLTTLGLADPSIPAVGGAYAGAGRYVANSAGVVHVA